MNKAVIPAILLSLPAGAITGVIRNSVPGASDGHASPKISLTTQSDDANTPNAYIYAYRYSNSRRLHHS